MRIKGKHVGVADDGTSRYESCIIEIPTEEIRAKLIKVLDDIQWHTSKRKYNHISEVADTIISVLGEVEKAIGTDSECYCAKDGSYKCHYHMSKSVKEQTKIEELSIKGKVFQEDNVIVKKINEIIRRVNGEG